MNRRKRHERESEENRNGIQNHPRTKPDRRNDAVQQRGVQNKNE